RDRHHDGADTRPAAPAPLRRCGRDLRLRAHPVALCDPGVKGEPRGHIRPGRRGRARRSRLRPRGAPRGERPVPGAPPGTRDRSRRPNALRPLVRDGIRPGARHAPSPTRDAGPDPSRIPCLPVPALEDMSHRINFLDPPARPRVRGLVSRTFSPRRVGELRPFIASTAERLLDELPASEVDLLRCFGAQLPSLVISEMLGVPVADREELTTWSDAVTPLLGFQLKPQERTSALSAAEERAACLSGL